LQSKSLVLKDY